MSCEKRQVMLGPTEQDRANVDQLYAIEHAISIFEHFVEGVPTRNIDGTANDANMAEAHFRYFKQMESIELFRGVVHNGCWKDRLIVLENEACKSQSDITCVSLPSIFQHPHILQLNCRDVESLGITSGIHFWPAKSTGLQIIPFFKRIFQRLYFTNHLFNKISLPSGLCAEIQSAFSLPEFQFA